MFTFFIKMGEIINWIAGYNEKEVKFFRPMPIHPSTDLFFSGQQGFNILKYVG